MTGRAHSPAMDERDLERALSLLAASRYPAALTGAGVSVESGIPPFRGGGGLWGRHDPARTAHIDAFRADPRAVWDMARELYATVRSAAPGPSHLALAAMEGAGALTAVITQNIDGLHRRAGSRCVVELHGSLDTCRCLECAKDFPSAGIDMEAGVPRCPCCGAALKPGMVFFGEAVPAGALMEAKLVASSCDCMIVIGTSAVVQPAAGIPVIAKGARARVIEINIAETGFTGSITDCFLKGRAGDILPLLAERIPRKKDGAGGRR